MEFKQHIETIIKKKLRNSQILLAISILIALGVFGYGYATEQNYYLWALYFIVIGALALPNIQRCKKDLFDYKNNVLTCTEGTVLDIFPEKETDENGNWIVFLNVEGKRDLVEFLLPTKPSIKVNETIKLFHTNILSVPVRVEVVAQKSMA